MLRSLVMLSALLGMSIASSSNAFDSSSSELLGGCGWHRCVNCTGGPCSPTNAKCIGSTPKYTFHLNDPSCDINDPNGPFYDPVHGLYHNFYQIHEALDMQGAGNGPDWGHWVSKDFTHWAQLPVAIWNDEWYDNSAIYTGSTTIVDGKPVIMYPGMCTGSMGCNAGKGGSTYVLVVPKNASDPFYTEWSKTGQIGDKTFTNPVLNNTGDDPSTAWKTVAGEWRIIGNQGCSPEGGNPMYGSMDFVEWYKIGCTTMMAGDCPTFFPLPKLTPGSEHYASDPMPDHVHKSGGPGGDQTQVGYWTDGLPGAQGNGTVGNWTILPGSSSVFLDKGKTHASKDFWDPVKQRRIMWVWGTVPSGVQTIPREMTYHPGIKRIVYSPVTEMFALRTGSIDKAGATALKKGSSVPLKVSGACDIEVDFSVPTAATQLSVMIGGDAFFIAFTPESREASPASDTWKVDVGFGHFKDSLPLLSDDKQITMRIFLDGNVAECYFQGGRVVMTVQIHGPLAESVSIQSSNGAVELNSAVSFQMKDIHVTPDAVLASMN